MVEAENWRIFSAVGVCSRKSKQRLGITRMWFLFAEVEIQLLGTQEEEKSLE